MSEIEQFLLKQGVKLPLEKGKKVAEYLLQPILEAVERSKSATFTSYWLTKTLDFNCPDANTDWSSRPDLSGWWAICACLDMYANKFMRIDNTRPNQYKLKR